METVLRLRRLAAGTIAPTSYNALRSRLRLPLDDVHGGTLSFTGTIQDNGRPVRGRVRVMDWNRAALVNQVWSDPVTGGYVVRNLRVLPEGYDVILYSPTYSTRAHVFRNVNPE